LKLKEEDAYSVKVFFRWHVIRGTLGEGPTNVADVKGQCYPGPFDGRLYSWLTKWKGVLKLKEEDAYSVKVFFRWHVIRGEPLST
jgi:hypothetical protein